MMRRLTSLTLLASLLILFIGCSASPEERAQKLYNQGKYEEIIAQYPTLPIAKLARGHIAETLLNEGKYEEVIERYADTPSATHALSKLAEKKKAEGTYDDFVRDFLKGPPCADPPSCAEQLYQQGKFNELIKTYPDTPAGLRIRTEKAKTEWKLIESLRGSDRQLAIDAFLKNPLYAGTDPLNQARAELAKLKATK
jgi:hypothetical protein